MLCYLQTEEKSAYIKSTKRFVWERPFFVITVCVQCLIVLWLSIVVLRYINPYINRCSQIKIKKHGESWVGSHKKEKRCFIEPNKVMANKLVDMQFVWYVPKYAQNTFVENNVKQEGWWSKVVNSFALMASYANLVDFMVLHIRLGREGKLCYCFEFLWWWMNFLTLFLVFTLARFAIIVKERERIGNSVAKWYGNFRLHRHVFVFPLSHKDLKDIF